MSGKGYRDRTTDREAYNLGWERIFGGKIDSTKVGVTVSPVTVSPHSEVGASPTASTIDSAPFRAPPIRHGIRKIIE